MTAGTPVRFGAMASAVFLVLTLAMLGFVVGVLVATRLLPSGGMGWDQLADFLGGAMIGTAGGFALGVLLAWRLSSRARVRVAALAFAVAGAAFIYLAETS